MPGYLCSSPQGVRSRGPTPPCSPWQSQGRSAAAPCRSRILPPVALSLLLVGHSGPGAEAAPALDLGLVTEVAERAGRSVVHINATFKQDEEAKRPAARPLFTPDQPPADGPPLQKTGQGSGFVLRADGTILTNQHVIENASYLEVVLDNGFQYRAKVVGESAAYDLAVLRIDDPLFKAPLAEDLVATLGDSSRTRVGDWVMAIGSPLSLDRSVTLGIVSARGRELHVGKDRTYYNLFQTDAAINPGNSGGPLIELDGGGRIIGINTAINAAGQGLGFAIPINLALKIGKDLEETGKVRVSWLGLDPSPLATSRALDLGLGHARAVLVSGVREGGPAAEAGIRVGDVVLAADGAPVRHPTHLLETIAETSIGGAVRLTLFRDGASLEVTATVKESPEGPDQVRIAADAFGAVLKEVGDEDRSKLKLPTGFEGVVVVAVSPGSPAHDLGLRPSDAIATVGHDDISTPDAFHAAIAKVPAGKSPKLGVFRAGYWIFLPR